MLLTTSEAAERLQCSPDNVRRLEREGKLQAEKTPKGQRIFSSEQVDLLAKDRARAREQKQAARAA